MTRAILLVLTLATPAVPVQDAPVQDAPMQDAPARVLTDTPEYCLTLEQRLAAWTTVPDNARRLSDQGRELCARGHVIAGIARLRRALVVLEHPEAP